VPDSDIGKEFVCTQCERKLIALESKSKDSEQSTHSEDYKHHVASYDQMAKERGINVTFDGGNGSQQLKLSDDSSQPKYLPTLISYMDCWRKHPTSEKFPAGRSGPSQCVSTVPKSDGIHYRCLVAFSSQNPKGFARVKYQIFHAELLRQGDCPKPLSRSITRRIPGISWLLVRPDVCPLADGGEYVIKEGGDLKKVSD
jgi:hypothetical protein